MFGIGPTEIIIILVVALIIFGPQRLPEIAAQAGKAIRDFRQMTNDVTGEFTRTMSLDTPPPEKTLEPQSTLGQELTKQVAAHTNGAGVDTLVPQTIGSDTPGAEVAAEEPWTPPAGDESANAVAVATAAPVATKADPLAGASLLDEEPATETAPIGSAPAEAETVTYRPAPVAAVVEADAPDVTAVTTAGNGAHDASPAAPATPVGEYDSAAAWEAVLTTEATAPLAGFADETGPELPGANGDTPAEREPIAVDPGADLTIREKIEAQVAAEAFRERRRRASYARARKRD